VGSYLRFQGGAKASLEEGSEIHTPGGCDRPYNAFTQANDALLRFLEKHVHGTLLRSTTGFPSQENAKVYKHVPCDAGRIQSAPASISKSANPYMGWSGLLSDSVAHNDLHNTSNTPNNELADHSEVGHSRREKGVAESCALFTGIVSASLAFVAKNHPPRGFDSSSEKHNKITTRAWVMQWKQKPPQQHPRFLIHAKARAKRLERTDEVRNH
jgi:hypothetical protein